MDLYGKLNKEIIQKEYSGGTSDTIVVIVDGKTNIISAKLLKKQYLHTISFKFDTELEYSNGLVSLTVITNSNIPLDFDGLKDYFNYLSDGFPYSANGYFINLNTNNEETTKIVYGITKYDVDLAICYIGGNETSIINILNTTEFNDIVREI